MTISLYFFMLITANININIASMLVSLFAQENETGLG